MEILDFFEIRAPPNVPTQKKVSAPKVDLAKKVIFGRFWQFSGTSLHLNRPKNDFLGTPQKTRISVKFSKKSLFFFPDFGSRQVEIFEGRKCAAPLGGPPILP